MSIRCVFRDLNRQCRGQQMNSHRNVLWCSGDVCTWPRVEQYEQYIWAWRQTNRVFRKQVFPFRSLHKSWIYLARPVTVRPQSPEGLDPARTVTLTEPRIWPPLPCLCAPCGRRHPLSWRGPTPSRPQLTSTRPLQRTSRGMKRHYIVVTT